MKRVAEFFALFSSASTLVCCALPALFVALGAGASFAGLVTNFPQLIWLSEHKRSVFIVGLAAICIAAYFQKVAAGESCPVDPALAKACMSARKRSKWLFRITLAFYGVGAFFAFLAPKIF